MTGSNPSPDARRAIEAVWRIESSRLVAGLVRMLRDVDLAEELAQDALVAALENWPSAGIPDRPGAWLMTTARRRAIDRLRQKRLHQEKQVEWAAASADGFDAGSDGPEAGLDDRIGDDLLRLVFIACHPVLSRDAQVALTLRLLGGLTTAEIARAFLTPEPTVAQRIVRAKRALAEARVPFESPDAAQLAERLESVLAVVYLIFNEGYSASEGEDWTRPALCREALRLGRILAGLAPRAPEVHGLLALMELQASRLGARTTADGAPILLLDQNRARWDRLLIRRGLAALERSERLGGAEGPYSLQAAIAACHARAVTAEATDWARIVALYGRLGAVSPSPVIELNRAMAVSMAFGPGPGLALVDALADAPALRDYPLLPAARGDLLFRLARRAEAALALRRAATLTRNARERALLLERALACERTAGPGG
jgi:RNA polymerase sigma factor (sigma-70 family)